jgi:hypothetical protein
MVTAKLLKASAVLADFSSSTSKRRYQDRIDSLYN